MIKGHGLLWVGRVKTEALCAIPQCTRFDCA